MQESVGSLAWRHESSEFAILSQGLRYGSVLDSEGLVKKQSLRQTNKVGHPPRYEEA